MYVLLLFCIAARGGGALKKVTDTMTKKSKGGPTHPPTPYPTPKPMFLGPYVA